MRKSEAIRYRSVIEQAAQSLDDQTGSTATVFFRTMQYDGSLIPNGTRINWYGKLKRAAVDLWDTAVNSPENAPGLWEDIDYKDGFRMIPEIITVTLAFAEGECGWWGEKLYRSRVEGNVYIPTVCPGYWEAVG